MFSILVFVKGLVVVFEKGGHVGGNEVGEFSSLRLLSRFTLMLQLLTLKVNLMLKKGLKFLHHLFFTLLLKLKLRVLLGSGRGCCSQRLGFR